MIKAYHCRWRSSGLCYWHWCDIITNTWIAICIYIIYCCANWALRTQKHNNALFICVKVAMKTKIETYTGQVWMIPSSIVIHCATHLPIKKTIECFCLWYHESVIRSKLKMCVMCVCAAYNVSSMICTEGQRNHLSKSVLFGLLWRNFEQTQKQKNANYMNNLRM